MSEKVGQEALFDHQDLSRRYRSIVVGFVLLYALCITFFYSSWLFGRSEFAISTYDNYLNSAIFVTSVIFSFVVGSRLSLKRLPYLTIGFLSFAVALISMFSAVGLGMGSVGIVISALAAGIGMSLTMPFFFESLAAFDARRIANACGVMALAGMALSLGLSQLPIQLTFFVYLLFLLISAAILVSEVTKAAKQSPVRAASSANRLSGPDVFRTALSRKDFLNTFLVSGVCTFALSIVYGVLDVAAMNSLVSPTTSVLISQFGGIVAALVFLAYFAFRKNPSPSFMFNLVFGLLATGFIFLPFLSGAYPAYLNIFVAAAWKLVMLMLFYLMVTTYARDRKRLLVGISLAYALPRLGLLIGTNLALLLRVGTDSNFMRLTAVAFFSLYVILVVIGFINSHERKKAETQIKKADEMIGRYAQEQETIQKLRCDALAEERDLTKRETEILFLLGQGRDLTYIVENLHLSKNTVKSYQKAIYAKLDVHSKQEVIDLVQGEGLKNRRS